MPPDTSFATKARVTVRAQEGPQFGTVDLLDMPLDVFEGSYFLSAKFAFNGFFPACLGFQPRELYS